MKDKMTREERLTLRRGGVLRNYSITPRNTQTIISRDTLRLSNGLRV
jgi:hypothetical protein